MVALVLNDTSVKSLHGNVDALGLAVVGTQTNLRVARHTTTESWHAQASFPVFLHLIGQGGNLGVDVHGKRNGRGIRAAWVRPDFHDDDLFRDMHLRRGQASAIVLMHGFNHIVDKLLDGWGQDLIRRHWFRYLAQYRMPQTGNFEYHQRHSPSCEI